MKKALCILAALAVASSMGAFAKKSYTGVNNSKIRGMKNVTPAILKGAESILDDEKAAFSFKDAIQNKSITDSGLKITAYKNGTDISAEALSLIETGDDQVVSFYRDFGAEKADYTIKFEFPKAIDSSKAPLYAVMYVPTHLAWENSEKTYPTFTVAVNGKNLTGKINSYNMSRIGAGWKLIELNGLSNSYVMGNRAGDIQDDVKAIKTIEFTVHTNKQKSNLDAPILFDWIGSSAAEKSTAEK